MKRSNLFATAFLGAGLLFLAGCGSGSEAPTAPTSAAPTRTGTSSDAKPAPPNAGAPTPGVGKAGGKKIVIGLVAKSQSNAVFQAAYAGAKDAAKKLGPKYNAQVVIDWQTPADEDAQKQAAAIDQLASSGAAGIAVSCTDAATVTPAIERAVQRGSVVVCFDSDALPKSGRMCYYGTEDATCGQRVMEELAKVMGEKGEIAILAGNETAPNLQRRRDGVLAELKKHPNMKLVDDGVVYHRETPEDAAVAVNTFQSAHPNIGGWAMIGGWPLFTKDALRWEPGAVKVVSVDALPAQLGYLTSGHVQALYGQDCYGWGYKSVELLLEKIVEGRSPPADRVIDPLTRVSKENAEEFAGRWDVWLGKGDAAAPATEPAATTAPAATPAP
ncbi:MAG: substrate-binding domain-containing protein [Planctomycetota bacterium]|nr:substrate-binding domain-containing protein [Planctomycetota bacterium]